MKISVLTYNIELGGRGRETEICQLLQEINADVIGLTEADNPTFVSDLAAELKMEFAWERGIGDRHLAVLSRFPITNSFIHKKNPLYQGALETRLKVEAQEIAIYTIHLRPYPLWFYEIRRWQAIGALLAVIAQSPDVPHIIMGDMNTVAKGDGFAIESTGKPVRRALRLQFNHVWRLAVPRLLLVGYQDCFRACHPHAAGNTFRLNGQFIGRFDFIFASPQLSPGLLNCEVVSNELADRSSDHLPVLTEFEIS